MPQIDTAECEQRTAHLAEEMNVAGGLHPDDHMLGHFLTSSPESGANFYFIGGRDDSNQLLASLRDRGVATEKAEVLEFAAGYGRMSRHLKEHCHLSVADIHEGAVAFARDVIGCPAYLSSTDPRKLSINKQFDVVVVISLFSHLPHRTFGRWLAALMSLVKPGGHLLFTTIGEAARAINPHIPVPNRKGYGFERQSEQKDLDVQEYGNTTVTPKYVYAQISRWLPAARLVAYEAAPWWRYQDQYVVQRLL